MALKLILVNGLTLIRIIGTIILIPIYKTYGGVYLSLIALICYLTDSIDGILARKLKASTFFGALFDGVSDKLFTMINFILLYMITPYAIIPVLFEIAILFLHFVKFNKNYNVKSSLIGKLKVWILAICVIITFFVSNIESVMFISNNFKENIIELTNHNLYLWLLLPAIIMELLTFLTYFLDIIKQKEKVINFEKKQVQKIKHKNNWEYFKNVWLNPEFYQEHKDDSNLKDLRKLSKE